MFNEPVMLCGRWTGANGSTPTAVAGTLKSGLVISRSGTGTLNIAIPTPIGTAQNVDAWICAPANDKNVRITPLAAGASVLQLQVTYHANGANVDVLTTEELNVQIILSASQNP